MLLLSLPDRRIQESVGGSNHVLTRHAARHYASNLGSRPGDIARTQDLGEPAIPRKTRIARLSRTMSSSSSRPTCSPILRRGTVVSLSTIRRLARRSPFTSLGSTRIRNRAASVGSVVNAQTVTDDVA